jgi:spore maturation protein CgeB
MNNFPVRKFFEIPAAGALLVCWPATGMQLLCSEDGVNCMFVRGETEASEIVETIIGDPARFEPIAAAGRDLVHREHSVSARATQLRSAVQRIQAGTFVGSGWEGGRFSCWA